MIERETKSRLTKSSSSASHFAISFLQSIKALSSRLMLRLRLPSTLSSLATVDDEPGNCSTLVEALCPASTSVLASSFPDSRTAPRFVRSTRRFLSALCSANWSKMFFMHVHVSLVQFHQGVNFKKPARFIIQEILQSLQNGLAFWSLRRVGEIIPLLSLT